MSGTTDAFDRVRIDALLQDAGWSLTDGLSVRFEHMLPDGTQADYRIVRAPEHEARAAEVGVRFEAWRAETSHLSRENA